MMISMRAMVMPIAIRQLVATHGASSGWPASPGTGSGSRDVARSASAGGVTVATVLAVATVLPVATVLAADTALAGDTGLAADVGPENAAAGESAPARAGMAAPDALAGTIRAAARL